MKSKETSQGYKSWRESITSLPLLLKNLPSYVATVLSQKLRLTCKSLMPILVFLACFLCIKLTPTYFFLNSQFFIILALIQYLYCSRRHWKQSDLLQATDAKLQLCLAWNTMDTRLHYYNFLYKLTITSNSQLF